jgi:hypothetical protein
MVGLVCDVRLIGRQQRICGSLGFVSVHALGVTDFLLYIPGIRNRGYGFVVTPMPIMVVSGLSYIFASQ